MDLDRLEYFCEQLYRTNDPEVRSQAEKACSTISDREDCLSICQLLLERSHSCYSQLIAATALTKYVSNRDAVIPVQDRLELRNYALRYLASHNDIEKFVQQSLVSLVCRLTKVGWFDFPDEVGGFRDILSHCTGLIESGQPAMVSIAVQLLHSLVIEMNRNSESDMTRVIFRQRKLSGSFRDNLLLSIFRLGLNLLREADKNLNSMNIANSTQGDILSHSLQLVHACLTYDFIGTTAGTGSLIGDETFNGSEEVIIQIPASWRSLFLDQDVIPLFFRLFNNLPPQMSVRVLSCLVQLSSIRRSLFTNAERLAFSGQLVTGACDILSNHSSQLANPQTYHEFCRFLSRIKSTFQVTELVSLSCYPQFLQLLIAFTVHTLKTRPLGSENNNCLHYLLMLWQRLVITISYIQPPDSEDLQNAASEISVAYIESCLDSVREYEDQPTQAVTSESSISMHGATRADVDELCPLDDHTTLVQQLEQFAAIGRCKYEKTCSHLVQLFEGAAASYEKALSAVMPGSPLDANISRLIHFEEHRLAWLVYMVGAVIGSRVNYTSADDDYDGELVCRVLQLMQLTTNRLSMPKSSLSSGDVIYQELNRSPGATRMELAILNFLEHFRRLYIGESVGRMSRVYQRIADTLGLSDELTILSLFTTKIVTNLKYWDSISPIINRTLALLSELSKNYTALRKMLKLDDVKFLLANHSAEQFPFLMVDPNLPEHPMSSQVAQFRLRTSFYCSLARLLMVELGEDDRAFLAFMQPITRTTNQVILALFSDVLSSLNPRQAKFLVIALARDLRGISSSLSSTSSYQFFLDWFYPSGFRLFGRALELWHSDPVLCTAVLKLLAEIANNRNGRLLFDSTVPTGYLLFTEISRILSTYGLQLIQNMKQLHKESVYTHKLKPIMTVWEVLKVCLSGNFINFGVFSLFQVDSLEKAIETAVQLIMCVEQEELAAYPKLSRCFFALLECLVKEHLMFIASLGDNVLGPIMRLISKNILSVNSVIAEYCCECLDSILLVLHKVEQSHTRGSDQQQSNGTTDQAIRLLTIENDRLVTPEPTTAGSAVRQYGASSFAVWSARVPTAEANLLQFFARYGANRQELFRILVLLFAAVMLEDCRIQWSITRPMLPLIVLNYEEFVGLLREVTRILPMEREAAVVGLLEKLMDGVDGNLTAKSREKFSQNVSSFKHALAEYMKTANSKRKIDNDSSNRMCEEPTQEAADYFCLSSTVIKASQMNLSL